MTAIALTIAGSDSGGGAGIQADLKTFSALGVYGASVVTAVTAQNTRKVVAIEALSTEIVAAQIEAVFDDLPVAAVKIGMLADPGLIRVVARGLRDRRLPVVLDPVMVAKSGDLLLAPAAVATLREELLPLATILTPNLPEAAELLCGKPAQDLTESAAQGRALLGLGPDWVLMKGGHAKGETCIDLLLGAVCDPADAQVADDRGSGGCSSDGNRAEKNGTPSPQRLCAARMPTRNTHGTGCTLSSAIAAGLAKGMAVPAAVAAAHHYLQAAIHAADRLYVGAGHGPVHHFHEVWPG